MNLKEQYKKETGKESIEYHHMDEWETYTNSYVKWLENRLNKVIEATHQEKN